MNRGDLVLAGNINGEVSFIPPAGTQKFHNTPPVFDVIPRSIRGNKLGASEVASLRTTKPQPCSDIECE